MIKYAIAILSLCGIYSLSLGQQPHPVSINKVSGGMTEIVSITGSGFGTDATKLVVFFGAAKGTIETVSDQLLEVHAPPGSTYENISVTNLTTGLTGYTRPHFLLSFGGDFGFDPNNLVGQTDFTAGSGLYDQCLCDFDGDNKVDIATVNDKATSTAISILSNTSSGPGNINFTTSTFSIAARSLHTKCGDLNGDGRPDIVVSEGGVGNRVFILQNNGAGFTSQQVITLSGSKVKQLQIADLDLDGKPEIIVSNIVNDLGSEASKILILVNQSVGNIQFATTPLTVKITDPLLPINNIQPDALAVEDLNGDEKPEIITSRYFTSTSGLFISENKSIPGTISFATNTAYTLGGSVINLKVGDLDGDRKPDIAVTQLLSNSVSVLLNTSTETTISMAAPKSFSTDDRPWGLDFGDLDGDGKTDIAVTTPFKKSITVLNNNSSTGNLDFQRHLKTTTYINRHINIGDLDGDGKPDIAFTSIDDTGIPASMVSVFRNKTCMVPEITPAGPLSICTGFPLRLFSSVSRGTTYEWKLNGVTQISGPNPYFDVTASGNYTVTAIAEAGTCSEISAPVTVNVGGTASGAVTIKPIAPICAGGTLTLDINSPIAGAQYKWTGPDNYSATGAPATLTNFQQKNAGRYNLDVIVGTCLYQSISAVADIVDVQEFQMSYTGGETICQGNTKTLSVQNRAGFSYQWYKDATLIPGAITSTYSANATGTYSVKINYTLSAGCAEVEPSVKLTVVTIPVAQFTRTPTGDVCANEKVQFTNTSVSDPAATATYIWNFGDTQTSTEKDPVHQYSAANSFNVTLVVSYQGSCPSNTANSPVNVTAAPTIQIINPDVANDFRFCEGDTIRLAVNNTFDSYLWSTGEVTPFIFVTVGDIYSIDATTSTGCVIYDEQEVITDDAPQIAITATPSQINEGETSQLEALGLDNYLWSPAESLMSSAAISNPIAKPTISTTYVVEGTGGPAGCKGTASIEVTVKGEPLVNKLNPGTFFSPNTDGKNDTWTVDKIQDFVQCGVTIYDDKGVKVFEAKPYENDWDGTFKGRKLPDGVYYYIIRCDGEENEPRAGSITVLR